MRTLQFIPRHAAALALAALLGGAAPEVFASPPTLVPYPAPGGNTALGSGSPIQPGGLQWSFSGFDPSAYGRLYYAIGDYAPDFVPGRPTLTMDGSTDALAFDAAASDLAAGVARWSGSTQAVLLGGPATVYTRFTLTVTDSAGTALSLVDPASLGLPAALGGLLDVRGNYKALWQFESAWAPGAYAAAGPFFDSIVGKQPGYNLQSSVGGAFYATPVPEPATAATLLAGLLLLAGVARRRCRWGG